MMEVRNGKRPQRPANHEAPFLSDSLWKIIEKCWVQEPNLRVAITELVLLLNINSW